MVSGFELLGGGQQIVFADGLAHDLAVDEELHGRLAGVIATGHEETQEGVGQDDLRGGQGAGRRVAAMTGAHE